MRRVASRAAAEQPFEAVRVDSFRLERRAGSPEPASRTTSRPSALRSAADGVLERPGRRRGRPLTPQVGDEPVGRDDLARAQRECGQQRALLPARQSNHPLAVAHLEQAEEANLHLPVCNTENKGFQVSAR